jgi:LysM repeat protein
MHSRWLLLPAASFSLFFASCANKGGGIAGSTNPQGLGPFDSRGNYVEAWADSPSQWKKGSSHQIADAQPDRAASTTIPVSPEFVKVEEVPSNAVPYQQGPTTVVYKKSTPTPTRHVEEEDAPKSKTKSTAVAKNTSKSSPSSSSKTTTKSKSSSSVAKSTPKPKTTVKKELVKSKPKAKSTSHTVKSGDNLYNIAKRYGTSVSAIQKANGTKSAMIRPGQSLVIPR